MNNCKIFDGHNDVLFRLYLKNNSKSYLDFIDGDNEGHLDLPRMSQANFKGGLFAIYVPTPEQDISDSDKLVNYKDMVQDEYSLPLPRPVDVKDSLPVVLHQISILSKIERNSKNKVKICLSGKDLETSFKHDDQLSVVMHRGRRMYR